jgi:streptogramin lyase
MPVHIRISAVVLSAFAFAACSGSHGAGSLTPAAPLQSDAIAGDGDGADAGPSTVPMTYSIKIPAPKKTVASEAQRHQDFVSGSTQSIVFQAYKPGKPHAPKFLLSTKAVALNAGANGCTGAAARTCKGTLNLPPPSVDLVMTTYNLKPVGKTIPKKALKLAIATVARQTVQANKPIAIALGGIPVTFTMTIPGSTVVGGVQTSSLYGMGTSSTNIGIEAFDAGGNLIVTDGYVNATGMPAAISMYISASHSTCSSPVLQDDGGIAGTSIKVTSPPQSGVFFNYGGAGIASPFSRAGYCSFLVSAKLGNSAIQRGSFVLDGPQLNEYPIGANAQPLTITVGPDGNIWFTDQTGYTGTINTSTKAIAEYVTPGGGLGIASYAGRLWISGSNLTQMSTSGTIVKSVAMTLTGQPSNQLTLGSDGNFWFTETETQRVARVTTAGVVTEFAAANLPHPQGSPYPVGMAKGSDGNMWFTGCIGQEIVRVATSGSNVQTPYSVPAQPGGQPYPYMMVGGPDKNLWFTSCGGGTISRMPLPTSTTLAPVFFQAPPVPGVGRAQMWGIAPGPDSDMWAADIDGAIDRVPLSATDSSQVTNVKVSESPRWVTTGPDGAIWFTEYIQGQIQANGMIGRIVP